MPDFYTLVTTARRDGLTMAQAYAPGDPPMAVALALLETTEQALTVALAAVPGPEAAETLAFELTYLWLLRQAAKLRCYLEAGLAAVPAWSA